MTIALIIYNLIMINHFLEVDWQLEDTIYYLKALSGLVSYLCGISLFVNGFWVLVFENSTAMRALSLGVHLYLNVWSQALKGKIDKYIPRCTISCIEQIQRSIVNGYSNHQSNIMIFSHIYIHIYIS